MDQNEPAGVIASAIDSWRIQLDHSDAFEAMQGAPRDAADGFA